MKTVIYTAIYGNKDRLRPPRQPETGATYVCISDDPEIAVPSWKMRIVAPHSPDANRSAKRFKVLAHQACDCERSIWIDGNYEILGDLTSLFDDFEEDVAFFRHSQRNCIYAEAAACIRRRKDDARPINGTIERFRQQGHPVGWGLFEGGVILRKHTCAVREFNERWWDEISQGTRRDQLSLPFVLRNLTLRFHVFDHSRRRGLLKRWRHLY